MPSRPVSNSALTKELRARASIPHTTLDDGTVLTREQALAEWIWQQALGWVESVREPNGNLKRITHEPIARWAEFVFERLEGKAAPASAEAGGTKVSAADKVRELTKQRLNNMVGA